VDTVLSNQPKVKSEKNDKKMKRGQVAEEGEEGGASKQRKTEVSNQKLRGESRVFSRACVPHRRTRPL
jgi:hypothetical protein